MKQQTLIVSLFLGVGNLGAAWLGVLAQGLTGWVFWLRVSQATVKVSPKAMVSS